MDLALLGKRAVSALATVLIVTGLAACGGDEGEEESAPAAAAPAPSPSPTPTPTPNPTPNDFPPVISGTPITQVAVVNAYSFTPSALDANGDTLAFSVVNLPSWATFNATTGRVSGTPQAQHVGTYNNVTISVTANGKTGSLAPFTIQVVSLGVESVTLSWMPPTQNEDGSALLDLAGYKIRYGQSPGSYTQTVTITNPGLASYQIDNLVKTTYYFVISAYNTCGIESRYSNEASKTL
jgi:hypothetical protein